jgi:nitrate/nitrite transporter NarK
MRIAAVIMAWVLVSFACTYAEAEFSKRVAMVVAMLVGFVCGMFAVYVGTFSRPQRHEP